LLSAHSIIALKGFGNTGSLPRFYAPARGFPEALSGSLRWAHIAPFDCVACLELADAAVLATRASQRRAGQAFPP